MEKPLKDMGQRIPPCFQCEHSGVKKKRLVCRAYPNGVPEKYEFGEEEHRTVQPDQVGTFVLKRDV
ncbi:hypothetical protein F5984_13260 [Rudanella paleaurantiibacter]|uniref:Uncharacterized protein n=1 Tax=Rudanella paleaurantiibacter TaxID=2614655 RepID=A0A7J5TYK5_9BACT|nr:MULTISPECIES: hypothetical protein [Rudanella]KAB7730145.1 hypothetical protein F5984_13260 [Rudanella paleaurantiibacter]